MSQATARIDPDLISVYRGPSIPILRDARTAFTALRRAMATLDAASMADADDLSDVQFLVSETATGAINAAISLIAALDGVRNRVEPGALDALDRRLEKEDAI